MIQNFFQEICWAAQNIWSAEVLDLWQKDWKYCGVLLFWIIVPEKWQIFFIEKFFKVMIVWFDRPDSLTLCQD